MRRIYGAACGLWLACAGAGIAQISDAVVVVELYTSQGCSSCPPADAYLAELAADARIAPLALHVDYWDYIGWADQFANPLFTKRQQAYARAVGSRMVYTPQIIVGGVERVEGHDPVEVAGLIKLHLAAHPGVELTALRSGARLTVSARSAAPLGHPLRVQLVRYRPEETVTIERGENAGKTITYRNIVTSWQSLGDWAGDAPLAVEAAIEGNEPVVVILQEPGPARIVAAARID